MFKRIFALASVAAALAVPASASARTCHTVLVPRWVETPIYAAGHIVGYGITVVQVPYTYCSR